MPDHKWIIAKYPLIIAIILIITIISNCIGNDDKNINNQSGPDNIYITAYPDNITNFGDISYITVQLYNNGLPYKKNGINLSFIFDDTGLLQKHQYNNTTDDNGSAIIDLSSSDKTGRLKISVVYDNNGKLISNSTYINITYGGDISGLVLDKNGNGTGNAKVTLWSIIYNKSTREWENKDIVNINGLGSGYSVNNPKLTNDGYSSIPGVFVFNRIPFGTYNLTAERDSHIGNSIVTVENGTVTSIITIPDYEYDGHYGEFYQPSYKVPIPPSGINRGVIWGVISDYFSVAINGVNVTLYNAKYNDTNRAWEPNGIANVSNNSQISNNSTQSIRGIYQFENVTLGDYLVRAEFKKNSNYAIVHMKDGDSTAFVSLQVVPPF